MNSNTLEFCERCGNPKLFWDGCYNCLSVACDDIPMTTGLRRVVALNYRTELYCDWCDYHGATDFRTQTGKCASCYGKNGLVALRIQSPARSAARRAGMRTFPSHCPRHGLSEHNTVTGLCDQCFNASGSPRKEGYKPPNPLRAIARNNGFARYQDTCEVHGVADFHTQRGKCAQCYNATGYRRPPSKWD